MHAMEQLRNYILALTDFSEQSWQLLLPVLTRIEVKKGAHLLKEGDVCNTLFYIEKGFCRSYYVRDGVEKNTAFFFENDIATNIASFGSGEPSAYFIQACEPLIVVAFDKAKLMEASRLSPEIETLGRKCVRTFAVKQEQQSDLFKLYTAQERYEYIERNYPNMLQRVSLTLLSSYLGVARETLSRIRKRRQQYL
jgi:CRP-like cAMP-binding protein